jgi:formylglycine-generating enzyme
LPLDKNEWQYRVSEGPELAQAGVVIVAEELMLHRCYLIATVAVIGCKIPDASYTQLADAGAIGPMDALVDATVIDAMVADATGSDAAPSSPSISCGGMPSTCGAGGDDGCCRSLDVPGGSYHRSYDRAGDALSGTTDFPTTISPFRLDKYEVTVGRFRAFVNAGMGTQESPPIAGAGARANIAGSGWNPSWTGILEPNALALRAALKCDSTFRIWTDTPAGNERRPMNCLTWYEAMAFCIWDGGYLPTEAEWNYVATGGDQQRAYPWSQPAGDLTINDSFASYHDGTNCVGDGVAGCATTDLVPVGSKPAGDSRWGASDLAGNVWEWMLDWSGDYAADCADCANLDLSSSRVIRGGSFFVSESDARASSRNSFAPASRVSIGARCARAL